MYVVTKRSKWYYYYAVNSSNIPHCDTVSWPWIAYHANQPAVQYHKNNFLLTLFSAHTEAMVKHSFYVIKNVNPKQIATFNQPLYALAKHTIKWPKHYMVKIYL